jgi:hypothetical protein
MRHIAIAAAAVATLASVPAAAQSNPVRPYVGVVAGDHSYDRDGPSGTVYGALAGVDYDLGATPLFVGAEGTFAKGTNDIDTEYGVVGTFGTRAHLGGPWKLFVRAGWHRVNFERFGRDDSLLLGLGADYAPIKSRPGLAFRFNADTMDFHSTRLTGGVVLRFETF